MELKNMDQDYPRLKQKMETNVPFELIVETKDISNVSMYMVFDFAFFLNKLKQKEPHYLKNSTIHVYSETIYNLLYKLFTYLCPPIAPVKVLYFEENNLKYIKTFYP